MHILALLLLSSSTAQALSTKYLLIRAALAIEAAYPPPKPLTLQGLLQIAPTSSTCNGAPYPDECVTAVAARPFIVSSFAEYNITHAPTQAALLSLMAYESGEFKYNVNHYPGVLGQGTRNMQSPEYNVKYAQYLGFGTDVTQDLETLMETLGQSEYSFGSAAWFLTTQCSRSFRMGMWDGSQSGWESYLGDCVGAAVNDERLAYWTKTMAVLAG